MRLRTYFRAAEYGQRMRIVHPFDVEAGALVSGEQHHQIGRLELDRKAGDLEDVRKLLGAEQRLFGVELLLDELELVKHVC